MSVFLKKSVTANIMVLIKKSQKMALKSQGNGKNRFFRKKGERKREKIKQF